MKTLTFIFFASCFLVLAADPTGTIAGNIADPSGAAVVSAKVTVTAPATGLSRTAAPANDGGYVFPLLLLAQLPALPYLNCYIV